MTRAEWIRLLWHEAYCRVRIGRGQDYMPAGAFRDSRERAALVAYAALRERPESALMAEHGALASAQFSRPLTRAERLRLARVRAKLDASERGA